MHVFQGRRRAVGKKCMDYDVEVVKPRGRPKKTWREVMKKRLLDPTTIQGGCCIT